MNYTIYDRTIAIAGIYQAVSLVQNIANKGIYSEKDFETCINSIFLIDVNKAEDTFGGASNLATGFSTLLSQIGGNIEDDGPYVEKDIYITKYAIGAMVLEKQLKKNRAMLDELSAGIERAREQSVHFSITHDNVIASLADLYSKTISTLQPRIMIHGEQIYLSNPNQANRMRALLLAAIRSVFLWRQCGGTRWQLIFNRRATIEAAKEMLRAS